MNLQKALEQTSLFFNKSLENVFVFTTIILFRVFLSIMYASVSLNSKLLNDFIISLGFPLSIITILCLKFT